MSSLHGIAADPLIASVHGLQPVLPHVAGEFEFRFPPATSRALSRCLERLRSVRRSSVTAILRNEGFGMTPPRKADIRQKEASRFSVALGALLSPYVCSPAYNRNHSPETEIAR
jgi:hypothetical protein